MILSNEKLIRLSKSQSQRGQRKLTNQVTQRVTGWTSGFDTFLQEFDSAVDFIWGDSDTSQDLRKNENFENYTIVNSFGTRVGSFSDEIKTRMEEREKSAYTFMDQEQKSIYAKLQLQKVRLAYQLAGVFQGGGSGSRTISDQDFKIILDALWGNNEYAKR